MLRNVSVEDAQAIHAIVVASLRYESSQLDVVRRRIRELAGADHCISLVWEDDATGEVQGFIHALRFDTLHSEGGWGVVTLAVAPECQGRGIGRALLEGFEHVARERGGRFVRLNSNVVRTDAHEFYEHVGYACDKVQKHFVHEL
ncbi:MAG: GNAT family N-acetyltransferase [Atopobiaceae bacterium]|nr:GNAT family N-acetyltransferase [Atopobiaceae bacterium]